MLNIPSTSSKANSASSIEVLALLSACRRNITVCRISAEHFAANLTLCSVTTPLNNGPGGSSPTVLFHLPTMTRNRSSERSGVPALMLFRIRSDSSCSLSDSDSASTFFYLYLHTPNTINLILLVIPYYKDIGLGSSEGQAFFHTLQFKCGLACDVPGNRNRTIPSATPTRCRKICIY